MKKAVLLTTLFFTLLSATSLHPGTHYNIFMQLFHNQHYAESALVGSGMMQQYPEFFKMPEIKLYTAVSFYKAGHTDSALELLRDVKVNYNDHLAAMNAELLLHLLVDEPMSGKFRKQPEFPLHGEMIQTLSLSIEQIEKTFGIDAQRFLKGKIGLPTCDILKNKLLNKGYLSFTKKELPYVMSLIRYGVNQHTLGSQYPVAVNLFITLLLIEQDSERVAIPYVEEVEITKKMKRKSEDNSKISEETQSLYQIIF